MTRRPRAQTATSGSSSVVAPGSQKTLSYEASKIFESMNDGQTVSEFRCTSKTIDGLECQKRNTWADHITFTHRNDSEGLEWRINKAEIKIWNPTEEYTDDLKALDDPTESC